MHTVLGLGNVAELVHLLQLINACFCVRQSCGASLYFITTCKSALALPHGPRTSVTGVKFRDYSRPFGQEEETEEALCML